MHSYIGSEKEILIAPGNPLITTDTDIFYMFHYFKALGRKDEPASLASILNL